MEGYEEDRSTTIKVNELHGSEDHAAGSAVDSVRLGRPVDGKYRNIAHWVQVTGAQRGVRLRQGHYNPQTEGEVFC